MHGKTAKNKEKKRINHSSVVILIGFAATFLAIIISSVGIFRGLESRSIDWRFKARGVIKPQAPVVIVAIDDESFASMPERWVWPRHFYARLVSNLKKLGAKAVGFDVIYSEPTARNPKEDAAFAEAVKKAGNVTLGMAV
ncbi:MAG TPA: CHASE2 domain-containing protein, partial [Candidatus Goldiibacteriota bacterium]|nr:CHASE2 domain-containing protein [Candidatus Goldiibacteriota bacterium]